MATAFSALYGPPPPTPEEREALEERRRLARLNPVRLGINVTDKKELDEDSFGYRSPAQVAEFAVWMAPGTGPLHSSAQNRDPSGMCAATACVYMLRIVLEQCLIFFGIKIGRACRPDDGRGDDAPCDGQCELPYDQGSVKIRSIRYKRHFRASADPELATSAAATGTGVPLTKDDLKKSLWDFLQPSNAIACVIYVQLESYPT
ncbi:hypothetical protein OC835_002638 [Tilletia horrida]|nr:hypothetical protein OC835_002638 [Tilletia horrida]